MSNSQLNKLKSGIKNGSEITFKLSSNVIGGFNDQNNFSQKWLLTNTQVLRVGKAFANGSSANIKLSKTQLHKIRQSGGFFLFLIKNVIKPLSKSILIPLILTVVASATDAAIHKKMFGSGRTTLLIIFDEEMNDVMKITKSLEDSGILIKGVGETIQN